jgi:P4 family phage/plasmid primase-like protien
MLVGHGANGKSVLLGIIGAFIGSDNVSGESLHQLENDPYSIAELYGKLVNIFPDLAEQNIYKNEAFKMLTGNEENGMRARRIYGQPFKFKNTARLIFSANKPPSVTTDDNYAYFRRWMIFEFLNTFSGDDADKNLIHKLTTEQELSGLFNLVIRKLKQLLKKEDYSYDKENTETERLYRLKSDPIALFSKEMVVFSEDDCRKMVMYDAYTQWCNENAIEVKAENVFAKRFGKMHEAGREAAPGPDGKRQKVWLSCKIRHGSVTVNFDNRDDKKTTTVDPYNEENNNTSLQNSTCLSRLEKKFVDEKFSQYGTTYRENRDGLVENGEENDIMQSNFCSSRLGDCNSDDNRDETKVRKQNKEVGQYQKDTDFYSMEKMIGVKIEHFISKYEKENRPINKANLTEAKHMIARWAKIEPSRVEAWIMKLCKIA